MPHAKTKNIEIWYETFGNPHNAPLLLIMGGGCQGILWPNEFCKKLTEACFYVIRYDHRDSGLSSYVDFENSPYSIIDMAQDALRLLDHLKVRKAHFFGLSLGGAIAQWIAANHKERTLSITLMATSAIFRPMNLAYAGLPAEESSLPGPTENYLRWMSDFVENEPKTPSEQIKARVIAWRILNGEKAEFDEISEYALQQEFVKRQKNPKCLLNHLNVCKNSEDIIVPLAAKIDVPTIIFHGTEDPIFPLAHGADLAQKIKHSAYVVVPGMGHALNRKFYDLIIRNIATMQMLMLVGEKNIPRAVVIAFEKSKTTNPPLTTQVVWVGSKEYLDGDGAATAKQVYLPGISSRM